MKASPEIDVIELGVVDPDIKSRGKSSTAPAASDWLCAWCLNRVANEQDRFAFNGLDEFSFTNPEGIRFEIITFEWTVGCRQSGAPTLEHTWFAGHAWCFCQCERCGMHLGWYYSGQHEFAGLIKERIVRAVCVRN